MGTRDRAERGTTADVRGRISESAAFVADRAARIASRLPGRRLVAAGRRYWQRRVREQPDRYQASITFPTAPDRPTVAEIHDWIGDLERAFEGHLDVYARRGSVAVVTDPVSDAQFDADAFEAVCERIEDGYAGTHAISHIEKWRRIDGRLVRAHVIVPVKPLFPHAAADDDAAQDRSASGIEAD